MKSTVKNIGKLAAALCLLGILSTSCKKSKAEITPDDPTSRATVLLDGTRKQISLDSLYLYAQQIYYWNDVIPAYDVFNPRKFAKSSTDIDDYEDELYAISQLKIDPSTGKPFEFSTDGYPKYSFIDDLRLANPSASATINTKASVDTEGNGYDIGIRPVGFLTSSTLKAAGPYLLFITAVYPGSPAAAANVQRGWVINKINNTTIGNNFNSEINKVNAALSGASVKIEGYNYVDKVPFTLTLNKASYKSSPVYISKVITRTGKKIGYLSYARFSRLSDVDAETDTYLDQVFTDFSSAGVTDLIIDLRYNGGGYVTSSEHLANLIAPSSANGQPMFTEIYNSTMQAGKATILKNVPLLDAKGKVRIENGKMITYADINYSKSASVNNYKFSKKGALSGVTNIVFIVSDNTASASELLINNLTPYMKVQLVGTTTYGKPVGFFPFTLENRYEVYMPLFETLNAQGKGGYYSGMVPGTVVEDDPLYPMGDEREKNLQAALSLIAPGSTSQGASSSAADRSSRVTSFRAEGKRLVPLRSEFNGMIEKRHSVN